MLFDTPIYFLFLIIVVLLYWRLNHRSQNIFLLLASYFFYGWWDWRFLGLMIGTTTIDYLIAPKLPTSRSDPNRKSWLLLSLLVNFAVLGLFKYFDFFVGSFATAVQQLGFHHIPVPLLHILLPPGISFYTFEEVAYMVDVYQGKVEPAKSFLEYGLFISLFPHLIAGPIQRPGNLLPQVQKDRPFNPNQFFDGLMLIFSGLFRKCVIADNCALLANAAFSGQLGPSNLWTVLIGVYAFAWQVYGDFSGYSDIARGSAQVLGFHLVVNFRQPYLANRLQDFWRRWHISLSTWLRDYVYIPLGGSRVVNWKISRNLMITLVLAGLWHGANWTYVIFGAIQGGVLVIERYLFPAKPKAAGGAEEQSTNFFWLWGQRILTFNIFCLSLVFFRARSLGAAVHMLAGLANLAWRPEYATAFLTLCVFSVPLFVADLLQEAANVEYPFAKSPYFYRTALAASVFLAIAFFSGSHLNAFIYFQF
ncbi:MAG TPA: MBOAT family O-acyltransferase [Candidatus Acidoferrum sp.]|nr:MBOAT family O-acyltransferase [Candidatus Acidoferrum sp.]